MIGISSFDWKKVQTLDVVMNATKKDDPQNRSTSMAYHYSKKTHWATFFIQPRVEPPPPRPQRRLHPL